MARVIQSRPIVRIPAGGITPLTEAALLNITATSAPSGGGTATGGGSTSNGNLDPRFPECVKAKAAGYGPYINGKGPEYSWYRDGDGAVCEEVLTRGFAMR